MLPCATSDIPDVEIAPPAAIPAELYPTPIDKILPVNVPGVTVVELAETVAAVPVVKDVVVKFLTLVKVISDEDEGAGAE